MKAIRLLKLLTVLQGRRTVITAEDLANLCEVSIRTIYRDIKNLEAIGVPIEGEAGMGYRVSSKNFLPPLVFNTEELFALLLGNQMVRAWTDKELAEAAQSAENKIRAVLSDKELFVADNQPYRVPTWKEYDDSNIQIVHQILRQACIERHKISIDYTDVNDSNSERTVWPLGLMSWGEHWTLVAWCELRNDFRVFRFDRIKDYHVTEQQFPNDPKRSFDHYLKHYCQGLS